VLPVITRGRFREPDAWHLFNILIHALRMLHEPHILERNISVAEYLINVFLQRLPHYSHEEMLTFNMHTLRHLPDHVRRFGTMPYLHTAVFESWLGWLKSNFTRN